MKLLLLAVLLILNNCRLSAQVQLLNSLPSATPVIFLDFDGHTVTGTSWNYSGPIICGGSGLSNAQITEVFNRVAEDYRPFVVNITTDSTKFLAAPLTKRMRVILTVTSDWYGSAGGVSFIGSFKWGTDDPCFVFSQLLNFNVKNVSEASSHEAGHTLGLQHQSTYDASCNKISEYNYGTGSGEVSWAPIMGAGYTKNLTIWHNGQNSISCSSIQNDMSVIASTANGITMKPDDNNNTVAGAASLAILNNNFSGTGTFEYTNDADLFKITIPAPARLVLTVKPANVGIQNAGANSDIQTELYNNSMSFLKANNPLDSLQASTDTTLSAGTYYFRLKPVANAYASTYGMTGTYLINGTTIPVTTLPLRKLELSGKAIGNTHNLQWSIDADEQITEALLEFSVDGSSFAGLSATRNAFGNFSYSPGTSSTIVYRMKVTFDNGKTHYSKLVSLHGGQPDDGPRVISNPVTNGILCITGKEEYQFALVDASGRKLITGYIKAGINNIPVQQLLRGIYFVQFRSKNNSQYTQKIIVQ